jgi:RNA polymerase sigma-B factor
MTAGTPQGRLARTRDLRLNAYAGGRRDTEVLRRYAKTRDPMLREQLVCRYLPLARYVASRYAKGSEPFDDLLQVASVGLLKAIDRFDPAVGTQFSSFAMPTMSGELLRHFRDRGWAVRPPRDLQERSQKVERVTEELFRMLGRAPTIREIGERLGLGDEAVLEAREALSARRSASLSAPRNGSSEQEGTLADHLGHDEAGYARAEARATIGRLSAVLTAREREVVRLRFDHDLTQDQIGRIIGTSQMQVSRILRSALAKLRIAADR